MLKSLFVQLSQGQPLSEDQVNFAVAQLVDEQVTVESKAEFLTLLARKGETREELSAFARNLRNQSIPLPLDTETRSREILDVCGTGGDQLNTFNISTTVALVVASAGVTVAKHGNRAITSRSGSTDVLEALGIRIDLTPETAAKWLRDHQFAFFFAIKYHPSFKHIGGARKLCAERGQRTIFNVLGPLLNPVRPTAQLMGVPRPQWCESIARVLQDLGVRRGMVVSGCVPCPAPGRREAYLDELSTLGENQIAEFYQDRGFSTSTLAPDHFPLQPATLADLAGGDRETNAELIRQLLQGRDRGPRRDAVLLNSGAALFVANKVKSLTEGWEMAEELIDRGTAWKKVEELTRLPIS